MAAPDTTNLTTSSDIFESHHTLPQIRAIHKSLNVQIDEKAARLRTQVGNSYRELLGTADIIVRMRGDMDGVQAVLGRMGGRCGRAVVGGKVAGLGKFRGREDAEGRLGRGARLKLLDACGLAVGRLLKQQSQRQQGGGGRGDRLVLAAKVLVLKRLLINSFGDAEGVDADSRAAVEAAKKSQLSLRRKLRRSIDRALDKVDGEEAGREDILKALCAYSLASSSGAKDVLWYFLKVRGEAMALEFDFEGHAKDGEHMESVLAALDLYTRTLLDVQALVPLKVSDALAGLKKQALLADDALQGLEILRLNTYERWCGEDIQYFTPFIRHDDLDGKQAKEMLTNWAREGGKTLLEGLRKTLERMTELKSIVDLRTAVLQRWIKDGGRARGFDPTIMLDGLREAISDRLLLVLDTKVSKLRLVGSEVATTLESWQSGVSHRYHSLWDDELLDMDIADGSTAFTTEITNRLYGRNDAVAKAVTSYTAWYGLIDDVNELVEQLRRQRWDNDVDEIEDEDTIEHRQKLLSKDDPQRLDAELQSKLERAYGALDGQLSSLWTKAQGDETNKGHMAKYLLRILRDVRARLPKQLHGAKSFGLASVPSLHETLALHVLVGPFKELETSALTRKRVIGRALWEGEPALPTSPSPGTFGFLRNLVSAMGDAGLDLWTPAAVKALKLAVSAKLHGAWQSALERQDKDSAEKSAEATATENAEQAAEEQEAPEQHNEDEQKEPQEVAKTAAAEASAVDAKAARRDLMIQWHYDVDLLQQCMGTEDASLAKLASEISTRSQLDADVRERVSKASHEYWKRTSLLFGLLA